MRWFYFKSKGNPPACLQLAFMVFGRLIIEWKSSCNLPSHHVGHKHVSLFLLPSAQRERRALCPSHVPITGTSSCTWGVKMNIGIKDKCGSLYVSSLDRILVNSCSVWSLASHHSYSVKGTQHSIKKINSPVGWSTWRVTDNVETPPVCKLVLPASTESHLRLIVLSCLLWTHYDISELNCAKKK